MYISACACHKWNDASQIIKITRNRGQDQNLGDTEPSNRELYQENYRHNSSEITFYTVQCMFNESPNICTLRPATKLASYLQLYICPDIFYPGNYTPFTDSEPKPLRNLIAAYEIAAFDEELLQTLTKYVL